MSPIHLENEQAKHTPGPWHVGQGNGEGCIFADGDGVRMRLEEHGTALYPIAKCAMGWNKEEDEANAAFIVKACNAHDTLMSALADCINGLQIAQRRLSTIQFTGLERAKALLAKTNEEGQA